MRRSERGAVLVETAIVAAALLTLMLGVLQIGIVGFEQLTIDAASFLNAHQTVIGVKDANGPNDATSQVFPNVKSASYQGATVQVAPSPAVPVDYGYNGTAAEQANAATNHVGGASMIQPYILQTTLKQGLFNFFGFSVDAKSLASEPQYLESDLRYGVSNLNYGQSNTGSLYRSSLFSNGENTPPFFGSWANIQACNDAPPWGALQSQTSCGNTPVDPSTVMFPAQYGPREDSMGMAEYLETLNWNMGGTGISGPVCPQTSTSCSTTGPFEAMACHQRVFSAIASFLYANPDLNAIETAFNPYYYNAVDSPTSYGQGVQFFGQSTAFVTTPTNAAWTAFANNIHTVYGWDRSSLNAYSPYPDNGVNELNPTVGCT